MPEFGEAQHSGLAGITASVQGFATQQYAQDPQAGKLAHPALSLTTMSGARSVGACSLSLECSRASGVHASGKHVSWCPVGDSQAEGQGAVSRMNIQGKADIKKQGQTSV